MAADNKLELVVQIDVDKANASIKSVNQGLSSIEQTAANAARGASHGIDGLTASMVKGATAGNLLADAIKKAIGWAKEWTIEAAKMAAHEARMETSTRALAKAHGINQQAMQQAAEAVKNVGFHTEDALHAVNRLMIADLGLEKAEGLAKVAKDAAAVEENITAAEALEKILQAIEFGNARALRAAGLRVDFEKEIQIQELKLGKTLSDNEKVQLRYNAVMRAAAAIQGAHAAAAGEAETQMGALKREVHELQEAVGAQYQEQFRSLVSTFRDLVGWLKDNADLLAKFGEVAIWLAGVLATYALAAKIMQLAKALAALRLASLNPYALLATGVIAAGAIVYTQYKDMQEQMEARVQEAERAALRQKILSGQTSVAELRKQGYTDEQLREIVSGRRLLPGAGPEEFDYGPKIKVKTSNEPDIDALKRAASMRKKQAEIEKETLESALAAEAHGVTGIFRLIGDFNRQTAKFTTFIDEKGNTWSMKLTDKTRENLEREFHAKVRELQREDAAEHIKNLQEEYQQRLAWETQLYQRRLEYDGEIARQNMDHLREILAFEQDRAGFERDARMRAIELYEAQILDDQNNARALQRKLWVEQQKMQIEVDYLEKVHEIKMRLFDLETSVQVIEMESRMRVAGYQADAIAARIAEFTQQRDELRWQVQETMDAATQAARESAAARQTQLIRDHNQRIFESIKRQAEGVFDALLTKSQSVWSAIGNAFKTAMLTAIKEIVTSNVARLLMQMFGARPGGGGWGWGSLLGGFGGLLGHGSGGGPIPDGMGGGWSTPPFLPQGGPAGSAGQLMYLGNGMWLPAAALLPQKMNPLQGAGLFTGSALSKGAYYGGSELALGGTLMAISGLQRGGPAGSAMTIGGAAMAGTGIGLLTGTGMYGGVMGFGVGLGAGMVLDAMRRGGKTGLLESTAGGALVGLMFGGPLGAAIGAGAGFLGGIVRLFVKSAQQKAREKIRAVYGVDISDKGLLKQIVNTAKQAFGGNLDMAIRSPQIRDLVELYAMSTGQSVRGIPGQARPVSLIETGGSLFQLPGYSNGTPLPSLGGLPSLDSIRPGVPSNAQPIVIQLDGPATTKLLQGEAVQAVVNNPRAVQSATLSATRANAGRRELTALQMSPGLVTA